MDLPSLPSLSLPSMPEMPAFPDFKGMPKIGLPEIDTGAFTSGPLEEVATADIYKLKSAVAGVASGAITSIQELKLKVDTSSLFDSSLMPGGAQDFLSKLESGALAFNKDALTARVLGANSEFKSAFNELNDAMKKGALLSTYKDKAAGMLSTINGVSSMVNSANIKDVKALGGFINQYTGSKIFSGKDSGAISGLLGMVVSKSSDLGIPGVFKTLTDTVSDNGIIGRMTRSILPIAMKNSDSKLLREMTSSSAGKLINVFSPGFTTSFSRAFTHRGDRSKQLNTFEDIFSSFSNIDNQWASLQRGEGNTALNLVSLIGGSKDFQSLVMTGVKHWATEKANGKPTPVPIDPLFALASAFTETTVGQAIARDFPKVALLSVYNERLVKKSGLPAGMRSGRNQNVVDARLISGSVGALLGF